MPSIRDVASHAYLSKRYYVPYSTSGGARWAFFAVFILVIVCAIIGTIRVNRRRSKRGMQPIYGTRWMTPPSYIQSQSQYDQPNQRNDPDMPATYVPTYTATANDNDMGFYDNNGEFHANPNAKSSLAFPDQAHHRLGSNADGTPLSDLPPHPSQHNRDNNDASDAVHDDEDDDMFRRPSGPPPTTALAAGATVGMPGEFSSGSPANAHNDFAPPDGPPPAVTEGSSRGLESLPSFSEGPNPPELRGKR